MTRLEAAMALAAMADDLHRLQIELRRMQIDLLELAVAIRADARRQRLAALRAGAADLRRAWFPPREGRPAA